MKRDARNRRRYVPLYTGSGLAHMKSNRNMQVIYVGLLSILSSFSRFIRNRFTPAHFEFFFLLVLLSLFFLFFLSRFVSMFEFSVFRFTHKIRTHSYFPSLFLEFVARKLFWWMYACVVWNTLTHITSYTYIDVCLMSNDDDVCVCY